MGPNKAGRYCSTYTSSKMTNYRTRYSVDIIAQKQQIFLKLHIYIFTAFISSIYHTYLM